MEKRNIKIDLITAKNWYKKGGELKGVALQAFKKKELIELPKTWEEFCENYLVKQGECWFGSDDYIGCTHQINQNRKNKNWIPSKKAAEAHLALIQLHQLRDVYRQGWIPDWKNKNQSKWIIGHTYKHYNIVHTKIFMKFLSFQTEEIAREFFINFKDLIIKAEDLI